MKGSSISSTRSSISSKVKYLHEEEEEDADEYRQKNGLSVVTGSFFLIAQMAGAGFLALPRAMADSGWIGFILMFLFCGSTGFVATRLGECWVILEQRFPEYRKPARQPYLEIVERTLGLVGRRIALAFVLIANVGSAIVFIILISELVNSVFDQLSICEYAVIVAVFVTPFAWLGTPKDFWQASVFAVISTFVAIVIIIVKIFLDYEKEPIYPVPTHPNPTFNTFFLGFGSVLFAFGGMSVFPTIQNDMKDRTQFWKSAIVGFSSILTMYFPIALFGYIYIGDTVNSNVILSFESSPAISVAIVFEVFNLLATFIITLSPVFLALEDIFGVPPEFGLKRILLRSGLILCELIVALAFPDFGLIVNLIGGSAMSGLSFIFPPLMYMKMIDNKDLSGGQRTIPFWERCLLWEICAVGIVGGVAATVSSLYGLLRPEQFASSCFAAFVPQDET